MATKTMTTKTLSEYIGQTPFRITPNHKTDMYIITGKRSNGETVFVCSSQTQGRRIVPYAQSMAEGFPVRSQASAAMASVIEHYKGIVFRIERTVQPHSV